MWVHESYNIGKTVVEAVASLKLSLVHFLAFWLFVCNEVAGWVSGSEASDRVMYLMASRADSWTYTEALQKWSRVLGFGNSMT